MSQKDELKDRIQAKKKMLEAKLHEVRADSRKNSRAAVADIERKLDDLNEALKKGWENVGEKVAARINKWLGE